MVRGRRQQAIAGLAILVWSALPGCALRKPASAVQRDADLRAELTALRTRTEELERKVAALGKRVGTPQTTTGARSLEQRLQAIEGRQASTRESRHANESGRPRPAPTVAPELDVEGLQRELGRELPAAYRRALTLLRDGASEQAIAALRELRRTTTDAAQLAGLQYWLGQAHMQLAQCYQAILAFTEVRQRFARTEYAPAAAYASGVAFLQLGNTSEARRAFEKVIAEHGGSPEAARAQSRLQSLAAAPS